MQAMTPPMPAPAKTAAKPPKAQSSAHADQGGKSFSKQLDRAENRRESTSSQQNSETRQTGQTQTENKSAACPHESEDKNTARAATDVQQQKTMEQQDAKAMNQELPGQPQLLEQLLQSLSMPKEDCPAVQSDSMAITPQQAGLQGKSMAITPQQQAGRQGKEQILATLLDQVTNTSQQGEQNVDKLIQQAATGENKENSAIVIENWQARFSYEENNPLTVQGPEKLEITGPQKGVQVQVAQEFTQQAAPARTSAGTSLEGARQPRDTTSNYIHSNLPGVQTRDSSDNNGTSQQEGQSLGQDTPDGTARNTQTAPTAMQSQDTPLIFSLDQAGQLRGLQGSQEGMQVSSLRLPSGTEVPHSQIVNQVTDHFSINRNLESGSVTLHLHPAELGELRMEIKVEQDNIKAHITTHNPQVQDILDRNISKLRAVLEQQGMNLEHIQVTVAADDGGSGQLFQEQFEQNRFNRNLRRNAHQMDFAISEEEMGIPVLDSDEQSLSVHA